MLQRTICLRHEEFAGLGSAPKLFVYVSEFLPEGIGPSIQNLNEGYELERDYLRVKRQHVMYVS